jgi:hypothetical protein
MILSKSYIGTTAVQKLYLGNNLIYQLTPPTPFEDYYNLVVDFGADTVSTFDKFTSWAGTDYNDWVHPSVLHFDTNWNGHPYWMAITAYGATQGANENPYLFYSDDGDTWLTPVGTPAPLHTSTSDGVTDTAYLSDTWLMYESGTMYVFNRGNLTAGGSYFEYRSTTDGINFTARTRILRSGVAATTDYVSPSVILLGGTWYIFATDTADTGKLAVLSSTSVSGTFTEINRITSDSGALWHAEVHYNPDDTNFYVLGSTNGASGGNLMFGKFSDVNAVSMETRNTFLVARGLGVGRQSYYKSAFIIKDNAMELFLGTKGDAVNSATGWRVQKANALRLTPTLDLVGNGYTLQATYPFADVTNGFTAGVRTLGNNKMALQFTVVNPKTFNVTFNRRSSTSYLQYFIDLNTVAFHNWKSGTVNYQSLVYGIKADDVVTIIRDETNVKVYVNGNNTYSYTLPATAHNYSGTIFGDFANNGSVKDLKVYSKAAWLFDTATYNSNLTTMYAESVTNPLQYIWADNFNRASLGTVDNLGNTYTKVGTPTITSNQYTPSGLANILGITHSVSDYSIFINTGNYVGGRIYLNRTDASNYRYIDFPDTGDTSALNLVTEAGSTPITLYGNNGNYSKWQFEVIGDALLKVYGDNVFINQIVLPANANPKFIGFTNKYTGGGWIDDIIVRKTATITPDTENPTAPTSLVASNITASTVDLVWTASTDNVGVTNYKVYNSGALIATVGSNATSYTVTGLTPETSYVLTVRAFDGSNNSSTDSNSQSFTTDAGAPSLPPYTYSDNFDDNSLNTSFWSTSSFGVAPTIREASGRLEIVLNGNGGGQVATIATNYNAVGKYVWSELTSVPTQVANSGTWWVLANGGNEIGISINNGNINFNKTISAVGTTMLAITYNATTHKWIRFRENAGITYWEYSADGLTWTTAHSEANPITMSSVQLYLGVYTSNSATGIYSIDNFYGF